MDWMRSGRVLRGLRFPRRVAPVTVNSSSTRFFFLLPARGTTPAFFFFGQMPGPSPTRLSGAFHGNSGVLEANPADPWIEHGPSLRRFSM